MRRLYDASFGVLHITDLWLGPSRHLHDEPLGVSNMVSEKRMVNMSQTGSYTSVQWRGDWETFKREMLAAGTLSGLKPALK